MHGVHQAQALANAAFMKRLLHFGSDVDEAASVRNIEPELSTMGFHGLSQKGSGAQVNVHQRPSLPDIIDVHTVVTAR